MKIKNTHLLNDSQSLREFLAIKGILFSKENTEDTTLRVHNITSQKLFSLGMQYAKQK